MTQILHVSTLMEAIPVHVTMDTVEMASLVMSVPLLTTVTQMLHAPTLKVAIPVHVNGYSGNGVSCVCK